jgi:peptide/nickel transport system substrate-binding protein
VTWKTRINLTLGYDPTIPSGRDLAVQLRTRLEDTGGLSVKLAPGEAGADLQLLDRKAWTATALAWLQPYLDAPLPEAAATLARVETQFRGTTNPAVADRLLAVLQRQSAVDLVMLPISQSDEYLYARTGVEVSARSFGPGWQLGLWGISGG